MSSVWTPPGTEDVWNLPLGNNVKFLKQLVDTSLKLLSGGSRQVDFGHAVGTSDGSGQLTVTFVGTFVSIPFVVVSTANASHAILVRAQSITTTGFKPTFFTTAGAVDTGQAQDCFWIAAA